MEAFGVGGSPGVHKELVEGILTNPRRVRNVNSVTDAERRATEQEVSDTVKAAFVISGADKQRYVKLKDELANNYLLGTDQYPDMFNKVVRILGNYQTSRVNMPYRGNPNNTGVAFLQRGRRGSGGRGRGGSGGSNGGNTSGADAGGGASDTASLAMGASNSEGASKTNSQGELHCFHCGGTTHWAYECPHLTAEQQGQLHIYLEGQMEGDGDQGAQAHRLLNMTLLQ